MPRQLFNLPLGAMAILILSNFAANPAVAVALGSPGPGEAIALEICSDCHIVSDRQVRFHIFGLPSFSDIASDPKKTEFWIRTFMRTPHFEMPNYTLNDEQLDNLIAYIRTLKE